MFRVFIYLAIITEDHAEANLTKCYDMVARSELKATSWRSIYRVSLLRNTKAIFIWSQHLTPRRRLFTYCC
jgi:hypothetical protein